MLKTVCFIAFTLFLLPLTADSCCRLLFKKRRLASCFYLDHTQQADRHQHKIYQYSRPLQRNWWTATPSHGGQAVLFDLDTNLNISFSEAIGYLGGGIISPQVSDTMEFCCSGPGTTKPPTMATPDPEMPSYSAHPLIPPTPSSDYQQKSHDLFQQKFLTASNPTSKNTTPPSQPSPSSHTQTKPNPSAKNLPLSKLSFPVLSPPKPDPGNRNRHAITVKAPQPDPLGWSKLDNVQLQQPVNMTAMQAGASASTSTLTLNATARHASILAAASSGKHELLMIFLLLTCLLASERTAWFEGWLLTSLTIAHFEPTNFKRIYNIL
ncbi:hypothetical protein BDR04DRAFT_1123239 [Suillus decipiens]|nr:hypothetical protein BDR04DRAFT_1123239 [Suillus decipiens]